MKDNISKEQVVNYIKGLTVAELPDFIDTLKTELNIPDVPMFMGGGMPAGQQAEVSAPVMEKTEFEVYIKTAGSNKIPVIKILRTYIPALSLVDAKNKLDTATEPILVKKGSKDEINKIKAELEAAGATAEVK